MTWNRHKRFAIVLFALVNLLFMQLAMAAYACPGGLNKVGGTDQPLATAVADMPAPKPWRQWATLSNPVCARPIARPTRKALTSTSFPLWPHHVRGLTTTPCFAPCWRPWTRPTRRLC